MKDKVNILGTEYKVKMIPSDQTVVNEGTLIDGMCAFTKKEIIVKDNENAGYMKSVARHEIAHAYLYESGLMEDSFNETFVGWLALQVPKMYQTYKEMGIL